MHDDDAILCLASEIKYEEQKDLYFRFGKLIKFLEKDVFFWETLKVNARR
jgi:hypothetical protein